MNTDQLLDVASYAGKLLIESGAEIYRVEETMVRLCTSFSEVEDAQSFVTTTGIMFSITVASKTHTKILRVHTRGVDLNCIDKINSLSRETAVQNYTIEELALKLREIENEQRYSFWIIMFFGALSAGGFAVFFGGNYLEAGCSFLIGLLIKAVSALWNSAACTAFLRMQLRRRAVRLRHWGTCPLSGYGCRYPYYIQHHAACSRLSHYQCHTGYGFRGLSVRCCPCNRGLSGGDCNRCRNRCCPFHVHRTERRYVTCI